MIINPVFAYIDFCHSDPRLKVTYHDCNSSSSDSRQQVFINQTKYFDHGYHMMMDSVWALTYYLRYCLGPNEVPTVSTSYPVEFDKHNCKVSNTSNDWKSCAYMAIASNFPNLRTVFNDSGGCYNRRVDMNAYPSAGQGVGQLHKTAVKREPNFRQNSWYGRYCIGFNNCLTSNSRYALGSRSQLIPLPDRYKRETYSVIHKSFQNFVDVPDRRLDDMNVVNVLVYDRSDTSRRQWSNAKKFLRLIKDDTRLKIRYITTTPTSFIDQALTYAWADIVVAPHGGAMVNTLFMHSGIDIISIWKFCLEYVAIDRFKLHIWEGWHAHYLNQHISYIQCHDKAQPYKVDDELSINNDRVPVDRPHKSRPSEVFKYVQFAIERQQIRLKEMTKMRQLENSNPLKNSLLAGSLHGMVSSIPNISKVYILICSISSLVFLRYLSVNLKR